MTTEEYLLPLRGQISMALWGYLHDEVDSKARRYQMWDLPVDYHQLLVKLVHYLHTEDALTQREWRTLEAFIGSVDKSVKTV